MTNADTATREKAPAAAAPGFPATSKKMTLQERASPKKAKPRSRRAAQRGGKKAVSANNQRRTAKKAPHVAQPNKAGAPRAETKGATIIRLIGRAKGATLADIMKATDWQAHTVRAFLSTAPRKYSLKIESAKNEGDDRRYKIVK